ncbi:CobW family GTP-binding protein [Anaerosacchariphilus polymeriproducens]|uniref:GTP-binding protein n=1 Tax=Anaerosacchariphilus polymeriproducens TaxID=1812858 RepID=A0A371AZ49_9FIRM|nr:CobW family GTP-binding protein [Anaerosacchariphilus polymeriproducens]RDU24837.1 GTP-binding protein [Anaerosacchariphilus polymeriproducens]
MTKVDIISGFLGAGKTTLIKKLIQEAFKGEKIVLIENEFGEVGVDGGFLKDAGIQITELNAGCICCTLVGDFGTALQDVLDQFHPDRIIIEPSGVGKLTDIAKVVMKVKETNDIKLNSMVTVVDGTKVKMYMKNFGEFYNNQIEQADSIIMSRTQKMKEERLEESVNLIKEHNQNATIMTTPWDQISGIKILEAMEMNRSLEQELLEEVSSSCNHNHEEEHEHECCSHHEHKEDVHQENNCGCHDHHKADEIFTSWGKETPRKYKEEEIIGILKTLSNSDELGTILRAKGIVQSDANSWIYFDMVPQEYEVRKGDADYTGRLCVIGSKLQKNKLDELFQL